MKTVPEGSAATSSRDATRTGSSMFERIDATWLEDGAVLAFVLTFAFGPPALAAYYLGPVRTALRRRAMASRCRVCIGCGYDLSGRAKAQAACPECGRHILTRDAVIFWARFLLG